MSIRRRNILIIGALGFVFIIVVSVSGAININLAPVFTLVLYAGLIIVTMIYAYYTMEIADAARQQAEATMELAKQTAKPRLMLDFRLTGDFDTERYVPFEAVANNYGNGPAYDIRGEIQDDGKPPSVLISGDVAHVLVGHLSIIWSLSDPRLYFPRSDNVQRRFFVIRYTDVYGEYEIRQPFVLTTGEKNRPIALLERPSKEILKKYNLEDKLP